MALMEDYFYNETISMYTGVFGSLFNEIKIRSNNKLVKVPIAFEGKDRQLVRREENPDPNDLRYKMKLPRMTFNLIGWQRDSQRTLNKRHKLRDTEYNRDADTSVAFQYMRVPYRFSYELNIKTKNIVEMMQIIEQILVHFNDTLQVVVEDNPLLNSSTALTVGLESSSPNNDFQGIFQDTRQVESTLQFYLDGYLYKDSTEQGTINKVIVNFRDLDTGVMFDRIVEE